MDISGIGPENNIGTKLHPDEIIQLIDSDADDDVETSPRKMNFNVGLYKYPELGHFSPFQNSSRLSSWELTLGDLETLDGTNWLSSNVIDCFMIAKVVDWKKEVSFFPLICTSAILGDNRDVPKDENFFPYRLDLEFGNMMFVPYAYKGHYCLIVMERNKQTICLYDPMGGGNENDLLIFLEYLKTSKLLYPNTKNNLSNIAWKIVPPSNGMPIQTDGFNCGVYISYYMDKLPCKKLNAIPPFDPATYRNKMKEFLMKHSWPLEQLCMGCLRENVEMPYCCHQCQRKVHRDCYLQCFFDPETCLVCAGFKKPSVGKIRDIGFPNGGNDCWFNAALQVIFRLPIFGDIKSWYAGQNSYVANHILNIRRNLELYDVSEDKIFSDLR